MNNSYQQCPKCLSMYPKGHICTYCQKIALRNLTWQMPERLTDRHLAETTFIGRVGELGKPQILAMLTKPALMPAQFGADW